MNTDAGSRIRAYRMKLEEWGFRKYVSVRGQHRQESMTPRRELQPPPVGNDGEIATTSPSENPLVLVEEQALGISDQVQSDVPKSKAEDLFLPDQQSHPGLSTLELWLERILLSKYGIMLPRKQLQFKELIQILSPSSRPAAFNILEILLAKWQSDGSFLQGTMEFVQNCPCSYISAPTLFKTIEMQVAPNERRPLIKACLLRLCNLNDWNGTCSWQTSFRAAVNASTWADAKSEIDEACRDTEKLCDNFYNCCLVVIAERMLRNLMHSLDVLIAGGHGHDKPKPGVRAFMQILNDFSNTNLEGDLDAIWYKYAMLLYNHAIRLSRSRETQQASKLKEMSEGTKKCLQEQLQLKAENQRLREVLSDSYYLGSERSTETLESFIEGATSVPIPGRKCRQLT